MAVFTGYNIVSCCFTITCRATASVEYHYIGPNAEVRLNCTFYTLKGVKFSIGDDRTFSLADCYHATVPHRACIEGILYMLFFTAKTSPEKESINYC